jgi:hypothetical protein
VKPNSCVKPAMTVETMNNAIATSPQPDSQRGTSRDL